MDVMLTPEHAESMAGLNDYERQQFSRLPETLNYINHDLFNSPQAETILFDDAASRNTELKDRLFLQYNYARYMVNKLYSPQNALKSPARVRNLLQWHQKALKARAELVRENLGLVLAMAKRARIPNLEFGELVSQGNLALLRSVENFDSSKGYKFSTYACRAILRSFSRLASEMGNHRQRFCTRPYIDLDQKAHRVRNFEEQWEEAVDDLREIIAHNRAGLTDVEQTIILERFAIHSRGKGKTYAEIGQLLGLTYERIRQIHKLALVKIRQALEEARHNSPRDLTRIAG